MKFEYDVCVIGLGRVGLPLALAFDNAELEVCGIDTNKELIKKISSNIMPFEEEGCQELLEESLISFSDEYNEDLIKHSENIIICIGTPILKNREIDFTHLKSVLDKLVPLIQNGQNIILRSTVEPNLSDKILTYIETKRNMKCGNDFFFSFCPERLVEGKALEEIQNLPQIIGCNDDDSFNQASILFSNIVKKEMIKTSLINAELSKVFLNMSRYAYFGIVNYFSILAYQYGTEIHEILDVANKDYPRPILFSPGLTGGTCLVKDWRMTGANNLYSDLFNTFDEINQNLIDVFLNEIASFSGSNEIVGILGYAFKKDSDDIRDSLTPKIIRFFENRFYENIMIHDPYVKRENVPVEHQKYFADFSEVKRKAEVLIIAMNHDEYKNHEYSNEIILDIWNITKRNNIVQCD